MESVDWLDDEESGVPLSLVNASVVYVVSVGVPLGPVV